jgi:hypothetical protein
MTDTDKNIENLAEDFCKAKFCYAGEKELQHYFKSGAKAGIKLERERSQKLVKMLKWYDEHGLLLDDFADRLKEYEAEGSGDE